MGWCFVADLDTLFTNGDYWDIHMKLAMNYYILSLHGPHLSHNAQKLNRWFFVEIHSDRLLMKVKLIIHCSLSVKPFVVLVLIVCWNAFHITQTQQ